MTITTNTASNAFNFLSFLNNSVDPRTGQYTLAIELPELVANNLSGPSLPLRIGFNPMNIQDSGFGMGWTLNLSQYDPATNLLHLHTGESFKVTGGDASDGTGKVFKERKLRSFHFHDHGTGYRVEHKAGLVELLELQGPSNNRVALPTRVEAPSGHGITLSYSNFQGAPCLVGIKDDTGLALLAIDYTSAEISLKLHPDSGPGGAPLASYTIKLDQRFTPAVRLPHTIVLPSDDKASWRLGYDKVRGVVCLTDVHTPVGGVETIDYDDAGHPFPGNARDPLPRVTRHTIKPGFDQPDMVTTYAYTSNNFLGMGSGITWRDNGEDNLYQFTGTQFSYGSTATYLAGDTPLRSITRSFNRFHLLTLQTTEQAHEVYDEHAAQPRRETCVEEVETVYHETSASFDLQPAAFQLPKHQLKRWKIKEDASRLREEVVITQYDEHGNLALESQAAAPVYQGDAINEGATLATTIHTRHTYYPHTGEGSDCPPDPQLFTRSRKTSTVHPAANGEGQAATLQTRYRYQHVPALSGSSGATGFLAADEEDLFQVDDDHEQLLQNTTRRFLKESDHNAFLHGRLDQQVLTLKHPSDAAKDKTATSTFFHSLVDNDNQQKTLLQMRETFKGHDLAERVVASAVSVHTGLLCRDQDFNKVETHYRYDVLNRLTAEIIAPGTANAAAREYTYELGAKANETAKDVNGVVTRTWFDGYNRPIRQERQTKDEQTGQRNWHDVQTTVYDSAGRVESQTSYDYLESDTRTLTSTFTYDGWGNRVTSLLPDGIVACTERSPFGEEGFVVQHWQERSDEARPRKRRQFVSTEFNRFDKPLSDRRLDLDGQLVGSKRYHYDGAGRCVREVQQLRDPLDLQAPPLEQTTRFSYDVWDRMASTERPDGSLLLRRFASHSTNELTTELELSPANGGASSIVCKRAFDGLERLTSLTVGNRTETFRYQGQMTLVDERDKASGRTLKYAYTPELTQQPTSITLKDAKAANDETTFGYDRPDAAITLADNAAGKRDYVYTDQGYLLKETWTDKQSAGNYHIDHTASLQGRPIERKISDGPLTRHAYDEAGRLTETTQGNLNATFTYDPDGRLHTTTTVDSISKRQVISTVLYDDLGRECERSVALDDGSTRTVKTVWRDDDLLHSRATLRDGEQRLLETFRYDKLNRLDKVTYTLDDENDAEAYLPRNRAGRSITSQVFRFDDWNNLIRCQTSFSDRETDDARFSYGAASAGDLHDMFQLRVLTHTLQPDYPPTQTFTYDADGNQDNDEWGRRLAYDEHGRLQQVSSKDGNTVIARYRYDGHDHLVGVTHDQQAEQLRRYEGYRLSTVSQGGEQAHYLHGDAHPLGLQNPAKPQDTRLLLTDNAASVTAEYGAAGVSEAHLSLYGERGDDDTLQSLLAFNGEVREQQLDWYLLGRGYRAYNPGLMRFHSPDSLPQEDVGVNPYLYALGNPVNWRDPTGHRSSPIPSRDPKPPYIDPMEEPKKPSIWGTILPIIAGIAGFAVGALLTVFLPPVGAMVLGVLAVAGGATATMLAAREEDPTKAMILNAVGGFLLGAGSTMLFAGASKGVKQWRAGRSAAPGPTDTPSISSPAATPVPSRAATPAPSPVVSRQNSIASQSPPASSRGSLTPSEPSVDYGSSAGSRSNSVESVVVDRPPSPPPSPAPSVASNGIDTTSFVDHLGLRRVNFRWFNRFPGDNAGHGTLSRRSSR
ncbi:RHS repeat-associated core domain-containing protein [Pseudomonas sp. LFS044]|uniref:RHS repeat-associated core domain-containing protein n=1 Tax=Pseudomonas sp. LFS044 TaxID=3229880 RepID=UPI003A7FEE25